MDCCWVIVSLQSKPSQLEPFGIICNHVLYLLVLDFKIIDIHLLGNLFKWREFASGRDFCVPCIILICVSFIMCSPWFSGIACLKASKNDYEWTFQIMSWYCIIIISSIATDAGTVNTQRFCRQSWSTLIPQRADIKYWTSKSSWPTSTLSSIFKLWLSENTRVHVLV